MGPSLRIEVRGDRRELTPERSWTVGRETDNDVHLQTGEASRHHATLTFDGVAWVLHDNGSANGTWVDGHRIQHEALRGSHEVWFGTPGAGDRVAVMVDAPSVVPPFHQPRLGSGPPPQPSMVNDHTVLTPPGSTPPPRPTLGPGRRPGPDGVLWVGRSTDAGLSVDDLSVSRQHARLCWQPDGYVRVSDMGSGNGTFVNGHRFNDVLARPGDIVTFGSVAYVVGAQDLQPYGGAKHSLVAQDLVVRTKEGRVILDHVRFALKQGEFLAIVGTSGAGKSTLTKALTGFRPADEGRVLLDGRDFYASLDELQAQIGYVPQDDILHTQLRLRDALSYGARLRFPIDVSPAERDRRVDQVMADLGLTERATTRISSLSGGQRKRTSVALELLTQPTVLLLDEPTSGLDPGYEQKVMELLRSLADGGRTVVVVTHSLQSLDLCDRVLFLQPGGKTAYYGPPQEALAAFGCRGFPEVFSALDNDPAGHLADRFRSSNAYLTYVNAPVMEAARAAASPTSQRSGSAAAVRRDPVRQFVTLAQRQAAVMVADARQFAILLAATFIGGLAVLAAIAPNALKFGAFDGQGPPPPPDGLKLIGTIALAGSVLGAAAGLREIVKERSILVRERAVGLSIPAYIAAKASVLGAVCVAQATILTIIATARAGGPSDAAFLPPARLELIVGASAMALAGMALGLLISALVATSEQAMSLIVLVIIFEYLLSGTAVNLDDQPLLKIPGYLAGANWGSAAMGSTVNLRVLNLCGNGGPPSVPCDERWAHTGPQLLWNLGALAVITVGTLAIASAALRSRLRTAD